MRISDWSSAVCSSDLVAVEAGGDHVFPDVASALRQRLDVVARELLAAAVAAAVQAQVLVAGEQCGIGERGGGVERVRPGVAAGGDDRMQLLDAALAAEPAGRSEEHTSELPLLMRISYAVFC